MLAPSKKDSTILAALSYALGLVVSLIIYLLEKEDKWVRFNALQALCFDLAFSAVFFAVFAVAWIFAIITLGIGIICVFPVFLIAPLAFILRLWWAYRALKGDYFELPIIGKFVLSHV